GGEVCGTLTVYSTETGFFGPHEVALLEEAASDVSFALDHLAGEAQRKQLEESLRTISMAMEQSPFSVMITDASGAIEYVNPWFTKVTGYTLTEAVGRNPRILKSPSTPPTVYQQLWSTLARGEVWVGELENRRKDGQPFHERSTIAPVKGADDRVIHYIAIKEDITGLKRDQEERRSLEAQLHQAQKLESLGSLAGGVAHDMNNVLGAILSLSSALREGADPFSPVAKSLDTIMSACLRGRGVVKGLLYFAQKDLQEEQLIDLNDLVREMKELLSHTTLQRIQLTLDLQEDLGRIRGDAGALSHALMNLCVNAIDAMPKGGSLRIQTAALDGGVLLRVQDTGLGMAPEVLAKAMEPFFTTKPRGKGTGLGLAMVYGTMKAHEGTFELHSQSGQGTEAILRFPPGRVERPVPRQEAVPAAMDAPVGLRVLLVDDDELIREAVGPMLEVLGHTVTTAPGGPQALAFLREGREVDLVILDMNMPGMSGAEALPRILDLRPELPVLMATGFSDHEIAPLLKDRPTVSSIRKPFSLKEIQAKIAALGIQPAPGPRP
ncbi:MAG: response regulator, partial [Geothrix sp.]|nr:response regulator [Geothrix sp.]